MSSWDIRKVIDIFEHCLFFMLNLAYASFYLILTTRYEVLSLHLAYILRAYYVSNTIQISGETANPALIELTFI